VDEEERTVLKLVWGGFGLVKKKKWFLVGVVYSRQIW
jgi:hypothetical protein